MRKFILMTSAVVLFPLSSIAQTTCTASPDCASLGYDSSIACDGGIKCPFGEMWNCYVNDNNIELETKQTNVYKACAVGHIFYSDMSCSVFMQSDKTPIGVVVYIDYQGHGQVLALKSIGDYKWGPADYDIPTLKNYLYYDSSSASEDLDSCGNTEKIVKAGDKSAYSAAWAAHEYSTEGTNAGDWCLPAAGIFTSYYYNRATIDFSLRKAGGIALGTHVNDYIWTSTESSSYGAFYSNFTYDYGLYDGYTNKINAYEVRPVLEF